MRTNSDEILRLLDETLAGFAGPQTGRQFDQLMPVVQTDPVLGDGWVRREDDAMLVAATNELNYKTLGRSDVIGRDPREILWVSTGLLARQEWVWLEEDEQFARDVNRSSHFFEPGYDIREKAH